MPAGDVPVSSGGSREQEGRLYMALIYCKRCDNIPRKKNKCKMCNGKGVIKVGKNGVSRR
jgi:hypothetical protein